MAKKLPRDWSAMALRTACAPTEDFAELVKIAGLDPAKDLRFGNFSGVSFRDSDLRGFDLSGANLSGADFTRARVARARFDSVIIAEVTIPANPPPGQGGKAAVLTGIANLRDAADWLAWFPGETFIRAAEPRRPIFGHLRVGDIFQDHPRSPEMIVIPAGSYISGLGGVTETVTIESPLAVGRFAVTESEWDAFEGSRMTLSSGTLPKSDVSLNDAQDYITRLYTLTGQNYRLLRDAEWEYVARAGTTTPYWCGHTISGQDANFDGRYDYDSYRKSGDPFLGGRVPVDRYAPNPWGLYNVHGNVWEWCEDRLGPRSGRLGNGVARGGSWRSERNEVSSFARADFHSAHKSDQIGFRVARDL
jgi:formylglycine-generating enzyme required for sulfatase activity